MNRTVRISVLVLAGIVAVLAFLYANDSDDRLQSQRDAVIFLSVDGERVAEVGFDAIQALEHREFEETLQSSGSPARDHEYVGVALRDLLESEGIDLGSARQVIATAADGYTVAMDASEVLAEDNVYLVHTVDGEPLGSREEGGSGPYQVIIRSDQFGQRWTKYLMEIEVR